jgi:hypothetical protein
MFEQRDEYAASQARGLGCGFWAIWTLATTFGGFLGQLAGQGLARALLPADADLVTVMLVGVPIGAVLGVAVGSFQGMVLMRYLRAAGVRDWVLASMAGGVLRWSVLGPLSALWTLSLNSGFAQCNALIPWPCSGRHRVRHSVCRKPSCSAATCAAASRWTGGPGCSQTPRAVSSTSPW